MPIKTLKINGEEIEVKEGPMTGTKPAFRLTKHIRTNVKRTDAFVRTIDLHFEEDREWLRNFRKEMSDLNRFNRKHGLSRQWSSWQKRFVNTRIKVSANGRLGIDNPNASKYRSKHTGKSYPGSHQRIRLEDARYADIYVHTVVDYPYGRVDTSRYA